MLRTFLREPALVVAGGSRTLRPPCPCFVPRSEQVAMPGGVTDTVLTPRPPRDPQDPPRDSRVLRATPSGCRRRERVAVWHVWTAGRCSLGASSWGAHRCPGSALQPYPVHVWGLGYSAKFSQTPHLAPLSPSSPVREMMSSVPLRSPRCGSRRRPGVQYPGGSVCTTCPPPSRRAGTRGGEVVAAGRPHSSFACSLCPCTADLGMPTATPAPRTSCPLAVPSQQPASRV